MDESRLFLTQVIWRIAERKIMAHGAPRYRSGGGNYQRPQQGQRKTTAVSRILERAQQFLTAFDGPPANRAQSLQSYYHPNAQFSISCFPSLPPPLTNKQGRPALNQHTTPAVKQTWQCYAMEGINHGATSTSTGSDAALKSTAPAVLAFVSQLPATVHKIESNNPGEVVLRMVDRERTPTDLDPNLAFVTFDGHLIEYPSDPSKSTERIFFRTITLAQTSPKSPYVVVNDMLRLGEYVPIFKPFKFDLRQTPAFQGSRQPSQPAQQPGSSLTVEQQTLVSQLGAMTGMRDEYCRMLLDASNWDVQTTQANFQAFLKNNGGAVPANMLK
ncbi:TAP C-terminal domain [Carpediemonas membranifera]|uniref:TAP C-terminal domain n=1 Tax=Carpediemonas membranifera TaxID=201153 RepID=A0A8J6BAE7_9EUKA|nr:TAP C-terminal domain [Carpediemonas membranifera]|eukprot:KAG9397474.1 TAP C-terminal domain [Carpediemonas membranifera]